MSTRPAGSWPSPITPDLLVAGAVRVGEVVPDGDDVWWSESRPSEKGRTCIVRWHDGVAEEASPAGVNVRTSVHEYGGGAWWAQDGVLYYVQFDDQRLRKVVPGEAPVFLSPAPAVERGARYADGRVTPDGEWFVCVREAHLKGHKEAVNEVVAVATDGSLREVVLASGADFYASPRVSPDGSAVVWIQWDHPDMPWDRTELWIADLRDGAAAGHRKLAGNGDEALAHPTWAADGSLRVVTDRTDWWNVYRVDPADGSLTHEAGGDYDIDEPHWVFGGSRYVPGVHVKGLPAGDELSVPLPDALAGRGYSSIESLQGTADDFVFVAASWTAASEVVRVRDGVAEVLRPAGDLGIDDGFFPAPEIIEYPTADGHTAFGVFYAPANPEHGLPDGEKPPLVVAIHGGPTSQALRQLHLTHRFWTSRGMAVVDVDYRGSSGYGRRYRNLLRGNWCKADVEDAVAAAQYLADRGDVDGARLAIRGGSAGGSTTLLALELHDVFAAGTNMFGVTDLVALLSEDHKFESRYTFSLIGPYPDAADLYAERSPINHLDSIDARLLVLQGADDTVVPPDHSRRIVEAMRRRGRPVTYHEYPGEGHGFRQASTLISALTAELGFYADAFGFDVAP